MPGPARANEGMRCSWGDISPFFSLPPWPHHHGKASFFSLCFAFSSSFVSTPLSLSPLPSFLHSFCPHPHSSPSLSPGSCLTHLRAPAFWAIPGGVMVLQNAGPLVRHQNPGPLGYHPIPSSLWSIQWGPRGKKGGREGRQPWTLGSKCCFW